MPQDIQPAVLFTTGAFLTLLLIAAWGWIGADTTLRAEGGQSRLADQLDTVLRP